MNKVIINLLIGLISISFLNSKPKNIIIMIADGWGYNQINAANYYLYGADSLAIYEKFSIKLGEANYPAFIEDYSGKSKLKINEGYNSYLYWSNFDYAKENHTESAASGTAIATGKKTYNGSIGLDINQKRLQNLTEFAKSFNKSAGVVTSVQFSHATPATFVAHNVFRNNYSEIAREMLLDSKLDVIIGCGHPDYDANGKLTNKKQYKYVGDSLTWLNIKNNDTIYSLKSNSGNNKIQDIDGDGKSDAWSLIETIEDFSKISKNEKKIKRLLGVCRVAQTLQQERKTDNNQNEPFYQMNENLPNLSELSLAALNTLNKNKNGFFLMIEGGAIDWANHNNHLNRLIEEMSDFNNAVENVCKWIENNGGWNENLLIVTGDHECGYLTGPKKNDNNPKTNPVINNGKGKMPLAKYNLQNHTNSIIPFFAKGNNCEIFNLFADEYDLIRGYYLQNSEIAQAIFLLWGNN